jgi:SNF2 family DNA or RNA helicase
MTLKEMLARVRRMFSQVKLTLKDLHQYQIDAEKFLYENPFSALFLDTGLGKTAILLRLINRLVVNNECKRVLIIAPQRVANVTWPDEIAQWSFSAWISHTIIRDDDLVDSINKAGQLSRRLIKTDGHGAGRIALAKKRSRVKAFDDALEMGLDSSYVQKQISEAEKIVEKKLVKKDRLVEAQKAVRRMLVERPAKIYLIHKEQVEFLVEAFGRDWPFDTVIIDESSSLKDHTTKRWKALWKVRPLIKRMHQLTATPAAEGYQYLFAQIVLLDRGKRFGTTVTKFREKFFNQNFYTKKWEIREGSQDDITKLIADLCLVMKQEDYLDLEQPVVVKKKIHLSETQMAVYRKMEDDFLIEMEDGTVVEAETAAALSQKLLQMASGVVYDNILEEQENGDIKKRRVVHHLHDDKIDALRQLEEEINGESMLIAYYHKSSLDRIMKAFPDAKPMDKAGKLIKEWNKGKVKKLLIHPMSDAHGLNLQKGGRHVVFFDLPWSYENYYQLYRRLARQGQKFLVMIHQLIAVGTIDEVVAECLDDKRDSQEIFFKMITAMRRRKAKNQRSTLDDDDKL